jgi:hypothetical protein
MPCTSRESTNDTSESLNQGILCFETLTKQPRALQQPIAASCPRGARFARGSQISGILVLLFGRSF